jgi:NADPH-dependent curcumin reductase CurA
MGARVIAAAGGREKLAVARSRGADELIDYKQESIRDRVRSLTGGKGADVVYDPVGGHAFDPLEEAGFELPVPPERKAALDRVRRPSVTRRQA